jgi:hypothetical protein
MQVITAAKKMSFIDLASITYKLPENATLSQKAQAEAALRKANPQLAETDSVPKGAVVVVPDVSGLEFTDATSPVRPELELINELASVLKQGSTQLTDAARQDAKNAETILSLVSSDDASTAFPDLKADLAALRTATKKDAQDRSKQATAAIKTLDGVLRILNNDLEAMKKRL